MSGAATAIEAFRVDYPVVGLEGNLSSDDPRFKGCSDAMFWHRATSLIINQHLIGNGSTEQGAIGKPCSFEDLVKTVQEKDLAPIVVWSICNQIARYGGRVAARALRELIKNPGENHDEFDSNTIVFNAAKELYNLSRNRAEPKAFPEHQLTSKDAYYISKWVEARGRDQDSPHAEMISAAINEIRFEPIERVVAKAGEAIVLARINLSLGLRRIAGAFRSQRAGQESEEL